jgi:general stress protein 26
MHSPATVRALLFLGFALTNSLAAQARPVSRDSLLHAARDIMAAARYAALITVDAGGAPQARTVDVFAPDSAMVVRIGTNRRTRKVEEIRGNPQVALYYYDPASMGYVTLRGRARLVDDSTQKARYWKPEWAGLYQDRARDYLLITVIPERLEIVSIRHGITGDQATWRPPTVNLRPSRPPTP